MVTIKALKVRIYPNKDQSLKIDQTLDCCRYVYNHMLARNQKVYERRGEHLSYYDMQNLLPKMKTYLPWLKNADSKAIRFACHQVADAYDNFFNKRTKFPRFKSKHNPLQSYTTEQPAIIRYDVDSVNLPKLGEVKHRDKRLLPENAKICFATISKRNDKYYCSVTYKYEIDIKPLPVSENQVIGLDYKSDGLFVDSNCNKPSYGKYYRKSQKLLAKRQRQIAKMQGSRKGEAKSNRWLKKHRQINKLLEHIANQRKDTLHKLSYQIANSYDAVVIEDLNMKAISNSDFGNGKATMDNGYGMFTTFLEYKLLEKGKQLVKVDKFFPSTQLCSKCGSIKKIPLSQRVYKCDCGLIIDRDLNSAINIRNEGLRLLRV